MITVKDHKTIPLFDPWDFLGPKRRQLLDASWAGVSHLLHKDFSHYILGNGDKKSVISSDRYFIV
jgi:hypothetical protein